MSDNTMEEDRSTPVVDRHLTLRLIRFLGPYWRSIGLVSFLSLCIAGLTLAGPKLVQVAIDDHIAKHDSQGLVRLAGLYILTVVATLILEYLREWVTAYVGQHAMYDLRKELFAHLQRLSLPFFDRN